MLIFKLKCVYDYLVFGAVEVEKQKRDKQANDEIFMFLRNDKRRYGNLRK